MNKIKKIIHDIEKNQNVFLYGLFSATILFIISLIIIPPSPLYSSKNIKSYYDKVEKQIDANTYYIKDLLKKPVTEEERVILEEMLVKDEELKYFILRDKIIRNEVDKYNIEMKSLFLRYKQLKKN